MSILSHDKITQVLAVLREYYPDARPELDYNSPFELLIAAILSAQCTDARVNVVTAQLFPAHGTPEQMLTLSLSELEEIIRTCGLYHAKAANILSACNTLVTTFDGEVPRTREQLMSLAGVGRKVANVVLSNAYGIPAIAVDTHVFRVANRIGLACAKDVAGTERQLMKNIPEDEWSLSHHLLIFHGRRRCHARKPECGTCALQGICKYEHQKK